MCYGQERSSGAIRRDFLKIALNSLEMFEEKCVLLQGRLSLLPLSLTIL